ncbi:MAG: hypothetical protein LCH41_10590 [Armatimonadetes bacterium]|nr:hypothetical protein [Armatimonadota bacterium]
MAQFRWQRRWFFVMLTYAALLPVSIPFTLMHVAHPLAGLISLPVGMLLFVAMTVRVDNLHLLLELSGKGLLPNGWPGLADRHILERCSVKILAHQFEPHHWQGLLGVYQRTKNITILRLALANNRDEFREAFLAHHADHSMKSRKLNHADAATIMEAKLRWLPATLESRGSERSPEAP